MTRATLFIILTILTGNFYSQRDSIFVWAENGLNFREEPNNSGKIIEVIPFSGGFKKLKDTTTREVTFQKIKMDWYCQNNKDYHLAGQYIKVSYKGQVGYVYSGYTSKLKPYLKGFISYRDYFADVWGEPINTFIDQDASPNYSEWYQFSNGCSINYWSDFSGRIAKHTLVLPGYSIGEVSLLIHHMETFRCYEELIEYHPFGGTTRIYRFITANEFVSEGNVAIYDFGNKIQVEISQDWE